jgi:hypothetical protein
MKTIYGIGAALMLVSISANIYNLIGGWGLMNAASKISFIFGNILFQTLIMVSFFVLFKTMPSMPSAQTTIDNPDLHNFLNELSDECKEAK